MINLMNTLCGLKTAFFTGAVRKQISGIFDIDSVITNTFNIHLIGIY